MSDKVELVWVRDLKGVLSPQLWRGDVGSTEYQKKGAAFGPYFDRVVAKLAVADEHLSPHLSLDQLAMLYPCPPAEVKTPPRCPHGHQDWDDCPVCCH